MPDQSEKKEEENQDDDQLNGHGSLPFSINDSFGCGGSRS
jgi:hypothetical protein